ncbi:hypothetical protein MIR68_000837 [Amoeboaphelidium protococcarum]|nr:hypothetical protein MIR68_000837 [Amoeboaphelidium protococcarum]
MINQLVQQLKLREVPKLFVLEELNNELSLLSEEMLATVNVSDCIKTLSKILVHGQAYSLDQSTAHTVHQQSGGGEGESEFSDAQSDYSTVDRHGDAMMMMTSGVQGGHDGYDDANQPECQLLALRCISHLLETNHHAVLNYIYEIIPTICKQFLSRFDYIDLVEASIDFLHKILCSKDSLLSASKTLINRLSQMMINNQATSVIGMIDFFSLSTQRMIVAIGSVWMRSLELLSDFTVLDQVLPLFSQHLSAQQQSDQKCTEYSVDGLYNCLLCLQNIMAQSGNANSEQLLQKKDYAQKYLKQICENQTVINALLSLFKGHSSHRSSAYEAKIGEILSILLNQSKESKVLMLQGGLVDNLLQCFGYNDGEGGIEGEQDDFNVDDKSAADWTIVIKLCLALLPADSNVDSQFSDANKWLDTFKINVRQYSRQFTGSYSEVKMVHYQPVQELCQSGQSQNNAEEQQWLQNILDSFSQKMLRALLELFSSTHVLSVQVLILRVVYRIVWRFNCQMKSSSMESSDNKQRLSLADLTQFVIIMVTQMNRTLMQSTGQSTVVLRRSTVTTSAPVQQQQRRDSNVMDVDNDEEAPVQSMPTSPLEAPTNASAVGASTITSTAASTDMSKIKLTISADTLQFMAYSLLIVYESVKCHQSFKVELAKQGGIEQLSNFCILVQSVTDRVSVKPIGQAEQSVTINEGLEILISSINNVLSEGHSGDTAHSQSLQQSLQNQEQGVVDSSDASADEMQIEAAVQQRQKSELWTRLSSLVRQFNDLIAIYILRNMGEEFKAITVGGGGGGEEEEIVTTQMTHLQTISYLLSTSQPQDQYKQALNMLVQMLASKSDDHVTSYEISNSSLVKSLLQFLTDVKLCDYPLDQRRVMFCASMFQSQGASAAQNLILKLQEVLLKFEDEFDIVAAMTNSRFYEQSNRNVQSIVNTLVRPIRIKLVPDKQFEEMLHTVLGDQISISSLGINSYTISVQCIAQFQSVKDFMLPKLSAYFNKLNQVIEEKQASYGRRRRSRQAVDTVDSPAAALSADSQQSSTGISTSNRLAEDYDGDDYYTEEDDDEAELIQHPSGQRQTDRLRKDSSVVFDIDPDRNNNQSSLSSSSPQQSQDGADGVSSNQSNHSGASEQKSTSRSYSAAVQKSSKDWSLQFTLDTMQIETDMTLYGAVHRYEKQQQQLSNQTPGGNNNNQQNSGENSSGNAVSVAQSLMRQFGANFFGMPLDFIERQQSSQSGSVDVFHKTYTIVYKPVNMKEQQQLAQNSRRRSAEVNNDPIDVLLSPSPSTNTPMEYQSLISPLNIPSTDVKSSDAVQDSLQPQCLDTLNLLNVLHDMFVKQPLHEVDPESDDSNRAAVPVRLFQNKKISAKLRRQMQDILIVSSGLSPSWCNWLSTSHGYLFSLQDRLDYLHSVCYNTQRALMRWQQKMSGKHPEIAQENIGRLSRQKVRISREKVFESSIKLMDLYGANNKFMMEVEFFDEVGSGNGPTLEFFSIVSLHFQRLELQMWHCSQPMSIVGDTAYVSSRGGLYPCPLHINMNSSRQSQESNSTTSNYSKVLLYFRTLGTFVAKAMFDFRLINVPFSQLFIERLVMDDPIPKDARPVRFTAGKNNQKALAYLMQQLKLIYQIDFELAQSLAYIADFCQRKVQLMENNSDEYSPSLLKDDGGASVEDLMLTMVVPGYDSIELIRDGAQTLVTSDNVEQYLSRVIDAFVYRGIEQQLEAFRSGFCRVFDIRKLRIFSSAEIQSMWSQQKWDGPWQKNVITDALKIDHGYSRDSEQVEWFVEIMHQFDQKQQSSFLQFITGAPKLPIGGFKALNPPLTIVAKTCDNPDKYLPSVMTCVNYVKLPRYTSPDIMKQQLLYAMSEGQGSFHLS